MHMPIGNTPLTSDTARTVRSATKCPAKAAVALAAVLLLPACADTPAGRLLDDPIGAFTGTIPPEPPAAEQRTRRIGEAGPEQWPNLADVPPRPTGVPSPAARQTLYDELVRHRAENQALRQAVAPPPPQANPAGASFDIPPPVEALPPLPEPPAPLGPMPRLEPPAVAS